MTSQARKELKWGKSCLKELSTQIIKLEKNNKKKKLEKTKEQANTKEDRRCHKIKTEITIKTKCSTEKANSVASISWP